MLRFNSETSENSQLKTDNTNLIKIITSQMLLKDQGSQESVYRLRNMLTEINNKNPADCRKIPVISELYKEYLEKKQNDTNDINGLMQGIFGLTNGLQGGIITDYFTSNKIAGDAHICKIVNLDTCQDLYLQKCLKASQQSEQKNTTKPQQETEDSTRTQSQLPKKPQSQIPKNGRSPDDAFNEIIFASVHNVFLSLFQKATEPTQFKPTSDIRSTKEYNRNPENNAKRVFEKSTNKSQSTLPKQLNHGLNEKISKRLKASIGNKYLADLKFKWNRLVGDVPSQSNSADNRLLIEIAITQQLNELSIELKKLEGVCKDQDSKEFADNKLLNLDNMFEKIKNMDEIYKSANKTNPDFFIKMPLVKQLFEYYNSDNT
ncbi:MAG: hypothetical protein GY870_17180, partial [archaeon]|nr:hypothetical protein [archaeon]